MSSVAQYTVTGLVQQLNALPAAIESARAGISARNAHVIELDQRANQVADPVKRAELKRAVQRLVQRQANVVKVYRATGAKFTAAYTRAKEFLRAHGLLATSGLNGLGVDPLVTPAVIAVAIVAVSAAVAYIWTHLHAQDAEITQWKELANRYVAGQLSDQQFRDLTSNLNATTDRAIPADPLGISSIAQSLIPLGLIALAFVVLPPIVQSLTTGRGRASRRRLQEAA